MRLLTLELENFRSYDRLAWEFSDKPVTLIVGDNGRGKTNFLEAMVVLSLTQSFQGRTIDELTQWGEEWTRVSGTIDVGGVGHGVEADHRAGPSSGRNIHGVQKGVEVQAGQSARELEIFWGEGRQYPKTLKVNGVKTRATDYVGQFLTVLFSPQDLNMVHGSPQLRRRLVDVLLSQVDHEYLSALMEYRKMLRQRNYLLGQILDGRSKEDELEFWDLQLATHGAVLISGRMKCFESLNRRLSEDYSSISRTLVEEDCDQMLGLEWNKEWSAVDARSDLLAYLTGHRRRDISASATCGGPHREDFRVVFGGRDMREFASRGECRTMVVALKLGERRLMEEQTGETPVLLLDDVLSELDPGRQGRVLDLFDAGQVVVTATHVEEALDLEKVDLLHVGDLLLDR